MKLLDALSAEHEVIASVASALLAYAARSAGGRDRGDEARFLRFFDLYANRFHHGREEGVLFPALVRETEVPGDRGPLRALADDHREMAADLAELAALAAQSDSSRFAHVAARYATALLQHIDAESSVLFPESEARFRRACVLELDAREPSEDERTARDDGLWLARRYGASAVAASQARGEGCACCRWYGVTCDGVEREWSSDLEWEDMLDRIR